MWKANHGIISIVKGGSLGKYLSISRVIASLRDDSLSEREKLVFYILATLMTTTSVELERLSEAGAQATPRLWVWSFMSLLSIGGAILAYRLNAGKGRFIEKMMCLAVPVSILSVGAFLGASLLAGVIAGFLGKAAELDAFMRTGLFQAVSGFGLSFLMMAWICAAMAKVNR